MKLTNGEIFGAKESLLKLADIKLPVKASFEVARMVSKLIPELNTIDKVKNDLVKKYGEPGENPETVVVKVGSEKFPLFAEEYNALMALEVEVDLNRVILPTEVDGKPLEIEPSILMPLVDKFIELAQ